MKTNLIIILLTFAFLPFISGNVPHALATEEINDEELVLEDSEESEETESHIKDRKKKKNSKAIHLPTAVIGGGNGKQDFTDIILELDREKK